MTVTVPTPPATAFVTDTFTRTVAAGGLGSADLGGAWTPVGTATGLSVSGGAAQLLLSAAGAQDRAYLLSTTNSSSDVTLQVSTDKIGSGGGTYVYAIGRRTAANNEYRARIRFAPGSRVGVTLSGLLNSATESTLASEVLLPGTFAANTKFNVRLQVFGTSPTTIRVKVWAVGTTEPTDWLLTATDSTATLQTAGSIGLTAYLSGTATNAPTTVTIDNLNASPVGTQAPNVLPTAAFTSSVSGLGVSVNGSGSSDTDGTVSAYSWSFGDGTAAVLGSTASHVYAAGGTYTVTLTVTDDRGGQGTVSHQVTVAPIPNQAPTAAFSSSTAGLTASFDGTGSSDSDGTVASYAWNFGDGATGTGATPSHTYAVAGPYTVTLTVTDNGGLGSAPVSHSVTVTVPTPPATAFVTDTFTRTVAAGGLGSADLGGAWTPVGTATGLSVSGGAAQLLLSAAGAQDRAYLLSTTNSSSDVTLQVSTDKIGSGGGTYVYAIGRRTAANNEYRARIRFAPGSRVGVTLSGLLNSATESTLASEVLLPGTFAANTKFNVRLQVFGTSPTTIRVKVWAVGTTEPTDWLLTATDSTATLQTAGSIGLTAYLSGTATNAPTTVTIDNLNASPVG